MPDTFRGSPQAWDELIAHLPHPHLLQTWEWAQVKTRYGWDPSPLVWRGPAGEVQAAAMLLKRRLRLAGVNARLGVFYSPKGPNLDWQDSGLAGRVLADLQALAASEQAICIKIDPDVPTGTGIPGTAQAVEAPLGVALAGELERRGWSFSSDQIQFRNTVLVDLEPGEAVLLERMKQKTRYNLRLAQKKGVSVRVGGQSDLGLLYRMYAETSLRDGFAIRAEGYYRTVWEAFARSTMPWHEPFIAEVEGLPVAAISVFYFAGTAYYLYGMSRAQHREKMPNYLLQWEAMRRARALGCRTYNLWGAPNEFNELDRLWGVFRFKEGLGGTVLRTVGAWDYAPHALLYQGYTRLLPRLMAVLRARGRQRTRQSLDA
jgi:lipid II:glycine glycyltransferase (peptidoglycan interpeptide bridge formation enzyme)